MPAINDSWACSDEFTKEGYRLFWPELDPRTKCQHSIDVTLTSCFTSVLNSSASIPAARPQFAR
jgi:hypothetical protein